MITSLPSPLADREAFRSRLEKGFSRFPKRLENYRKYLENRRGVIVDYLPVKMDIEVTSRCNYRCQMCPVSQWPEGKRADDLGYGDFKSFLDEQYGLVEIKLQGLGEPLYNDDFFDMISLSAERDIWTRTTINGSMLLVKDNYKRLIDSDPGEVQVSFDGATKNTFERIRKGSNFDQVVRGIIALNSYAESKGLLKTRCWTVVQKDNFHELKDIVRLCSKMKFKRLTFSTTLSGFGVDRWADQLKGIDVADNFTPKMAEELIALGFEHGIEVTFWNVSSKYEIGSGSEKLCDWLWERSYISSDMRIVPCCAIANPETLDLGCARSFNKAWNSEKYKLLRAAHLEENLPSYCRQCYAL